MTDARPGASTRNRYTRDTPGGGGVEAEEPPGSLLKPGGGGLEAEETPGSLLLLPASPEITS